MINKKKILLVTINGCSPNSGFASRVKLMAKTLEKHVGHVTLLRFYPMFRSKGTWKNDEVAKVISVIEIPVFPMSRSTFLREISFFLSNLFIHAFSLLKKIDCIQAESHEAAHVVLLRRMSSIPVFVDYHGAVVEEALFAKRNHPVKKSKRSWHYKAEENSLKAEAHFFVSKKLKDYLSNMHGSYRKETSHIVPINVDDEFFKIRDRFLIRNKLRVKDDEILFVYSGGCQEYQCINEMMEIFFKLRNKINNIKLLILTMNIQNFKNILDAKFRDNLDEIIFLTGSNKQQIAEYLSSADYAFLLRRDECLNIVSCPTKFGEYLASGIPVVTTPWAGHAPEIVEKYDMGIVVNLVESDVSRILNFILKGKQDSNRIRKIATEQVHWNQSEDVLTRFYSNFFSN